MSSREKLFNLILSLTDEEVEKIAAFLRNNQDKPVAAERKQSE